MKCKHEPCNNDAMGKGAYCSKSCRAKQSKRNRAGAITEAQPVETPAQQANEVIEGCAVYGRQAVKCSKYDTRPMPLDSTDQPHSGGRGKYTRQDGTTYQFDSSGNAHDDQPASTMP